MSIIVSPHNEREEKVLKAFLKSLEYDYFEEDDPEIPAPKRTKRQTLKEYNEELEKAVSEVVSGNYITHEEALKAINSWKDK
jgi:hypothetical protein